MIKKIAIPSFKLPLALAISACSLTTLAQSDESREVAQIEEVISWGTQVYSTSASLNGEAMAIRQADHLSDLMRSVPGVDIGGAHSLNQRINIRGLDDKDLRISIDGANQNTYMYHHAGNLQIHADILKAVEIEVGANSVINGGLGGSVRFQTKEAKDLLDRDAKVGARMQGSYASNASTGISLSSYGQLTDELDALAYFNFVDRENYTVGGGQIIGSNGVVIDEDGEVTGLAGETSDLLLKLGWDPSETQRFEIGHESYKDEGDYSYRPDMGLATDLAIAESLGLPLTYPTEFTRETNTLNYEASISSHSTLHATLFTNDSELWRDESGVAAVYADSPSLVEGEAKNTGFNILANTVFGNTIEHSLTYGLDVIEFETEYRNDGAFVSGEDAKNSAVFIEDKIFFGKGFSVTPGLRYDSYKVNSVVVTETFSDTTAALALEQIVNDSLLVRVNTTQIFKGPELSEVFVGAGVNDTPNPDIKAESGSNNQLALVWNSKGFSTGLTVFRTEIENYIYEYADDNIGDLAIDGFESYLGYDKDDFSILVSYSSSDSELDAYTGYDDFDGARLDRSIGDNISINVDYLISNLNTRLHWESLIVDKLDARPDLDELNNAKPGYSTHNISARWASDSVKQLEVIFGIENLFDELYASQASRTGESTHPRFGALHLTDYEPGRNIKLTVAYAF